MEESQVSSDHIKSYQSKTWCSAVVNLSRVDTRVDTLVRDNVSTGIQILQPIWSMSLAGLEIVSLRYGNATHRMGFSILESNYASVGPAPSGFSIPQSSKELKTLQAEWDLQHHDSMIETTEP